MADARKGWQVGKHVAPARFIVFLALMVAGVAAAALLLHLSLGRALLVGFDAASALFLASLYPLLDDESDEMRDRSAANDANRPVLLAITGLVMIVILVAVANELAGRPTPTAVALVIATLVLSWLFSNVVYALHYAHVFYRDADNDHKDDGGLDFPDCDEPRYKDFLYFSFTLGMTFQTSDVSITTAAMRWIALGHTMVAFVFNIGVLAFTINVLGGGS